MDIKNGDLPVTPIVNEHGHPYHASHVAFDNTPLVSGLSKREAFAMAAMQNILTCYNPYEQGDFDSSDYDLTAEHAFCLADAMLRRGEMKWPLTN